MSLNTNGIHFFEPGGELVEFLIIDRGDDGIVSHESLYHPSVEDIQAACFRHGVPADGIVDIIRNKEKTVHTFFMDVQQYLKGLEEKEKTFLLEITKGEPRGYVKGSWSYAFDCPLCDYKVDKDLDFSYVEARALNHLGDRHRVRRQKIRIEFKEEK